MAKIIPFKPKTRNLRGQFRLAANMLDDFAMEEYLRASRVERESMLVDLANDMADRIEVHKDLKDKFIEPIHTSLLYGFNQLFSLDEGEQSPKRVKDAYDTTKDFIVRTSADRAMMLGINIDR